MMHVTVTHYGCREYLRRRGFITEGELVSVPVLQLRVTIADIQHAVSAYFGMPLREMTSARRSRDIVRPRQIAMYLAKHLTTRSLPEIGRRFGDRDHTTVIHAVRQIERLRREDAAIATAVAALETTINVNFGRYDVMARRRLPARGAA